MPREVACPFVDSSPLELPPDFVISSSKVLAQKINIKAIRVYITLRIKKMGKTSKNNDISMFINFLSNFANLSDAEIYLSELEILNAY